MSDIYTTPWAGAAESLYLNVGVAIDPAETAAESLYMNVGVFIDPAETAAESLYMNVGVFIDPAETAVESLYFAVLDGTPDPYVFALRPTAGRAGDGVTVLGSGFGASQAQYNGVVEAYDTEAGIWTTLPVTSWSRIPASADAYTANRVIEPYTPDVDPEHEEIQVTVPSWADPPTLNVRVRTDGP